MVVEVEDDLMDSDNDDTPKDTTRYLCLPVYCLFSLHMVVRKRLQKKSNAKKRPVTTEITSNIASPVSESKSPDTKRRKVNVEQKEVVEVIETSKTPMEIKPSIQLKKLNTQGAINTAKKIEVYIYSIVTMLF